MSKKLVLSISGGMDSVVLLHMAVDRGYDDINLITFNYGQRHIREIDCIQDQVDAVKAKDPNVNIDHYVADVGFIKYLAPTSSLSVYCIMLYLLINCLHRFSNNIYTF